MPKEASSDLERATMGSRPPGARIHRRPAAHTAGQRRPTAPRDAARRRGTPPAPPGAAAPNTSPLTSGRKPRRCPHQQPRGGPGDCLRRRRGGKIRGGGVAADGGREPSSRPREGDARGGGRKGLSQIVVRCICFSAPPSAAYYLAAEKPAAMVIPPPDRAARIVGFLKPYLLRMHLSSKYVNAQVTHTSTATIA